MAFHITAADDTQLYLSFHPDDLTIAARRCDTTELLVVSANPSFHHNFTFQLDSSTITPSKTARNLGVVIDDQLNFTDYINKTAQFCILYFSRDFFKTAREAQLPL